MNAPSSPPDATVSLRRRLVRLNRRVKSTLPNRAVFGGAIVTAIATHVLLSVPAAISYVEFRRELNRLIGFYFLENPFPPVQFLGGIVGGYTAGYLTGEKWYTAFVNGIRAVLLGICLYYVGIVLDDLVRFLASNDLTGSVAMIVVIQPLIFVLIPFGLLYFFESSVTSLIGNITANFLARRYSMAAFEDHAEDVSPVLLGMFRGVLATLVLLATFLAIWGFVFFLQARY